MARNVQPRENYAAESATLSRWMKVVGVDSVRPSQWRRAALEHMQALQKLFTDDLVGQADVAPTEDKRRTRTTKATRS